jgi:hypothetical protein
MPRVTGLVNFAAALAVQGRLHDADVTVKAVTLEYAGFWPALKLQAYLNLRMGDPKGALEIFRPSKNQQ